MLYSYLSELSAFWYRFRCYEHLKQLLGALNLKDWVFTLIYITVLGEMLGLIVTDQNFTTHLTKFFLLRFIPL